MKLLFRRFNPVSDIQRSFDCGNTALNEFLLESNVCKQNATYHTIELLSVTYILEQPETHAIIAYFSLLHDKIEREFTDSATWNRLSRKIPNAKRKSSYPALKIGRLAINKPFQGQGIGGKILHFIEQYYLKKQIAGCRYITVDALQSAMPFYEKHRFQKMVSSEKDETILMFFDLKSIVSN